MIDIIIATYNRFQKTIDLSTNLLVASELVRKVFIIDSSDNLNKAQTITNSLVLIKTSCKNQPYQRYLGYIASTAPILLFLDDDMELLDGKVFEDIEKIMLNPQIVAINLPFENHNNFLAEQPKGLVDSKSKMRSLIGCLSGYPAAKPNQYLHNGIRGTRTIGQPIEYLSGGAFAVKREVLYKSFNMQLFSIYMSKLGKGEDGILGYTLSKQGQIYTYPDKCFVHNDFNDSSYASSQEAFATRVLYSRLYLSCEYYRLNQKPVILGYLRFWHYAFGRIVGSGLSLIVSPTKSKAEILKGNIKALIISFRFKFDKTRQANSYWQQEAVKDLNS